MGSERYTPISRAEIPILPNGFGRKSIALFERPAALRGFLDGRRVANQEAAEDFDPELDFDDLVEGLCLVALRDDIRFETRSHPTRYRDSVPGMHPRDYVLRTANRFWFAEYRSGTFTRVVAQPLGTILQACRAVVRESVTVIPMPRLERWMCCDGGALAHRERKLIQYPGAYKELYESGTFAGILNRAFCHLECGEDFVWIEDDLCLLWMRGIGVPDLEWIRLFPFRVDRSCGSGRLLRDFKPKSFLWRNLLLPPKRRRPSIATRWYEVQRTSAD